MRNPDWIYRTDKDNRFRFLLGKKGGKMLAIIGANPSTAAPGSPDRTVAKMQKIALKNGYDGWILCNLWPERQTHPDQLRKRMLRAIHQENLMCIQEALQQYPITAIWAGWGNIIDKRPYLSRCLRDIYTLEPCRRLTWLQLHATAKGHPRHPLYQSVDTPLIPFDVKGYTAKCWR